VDHVFELVLPRYVPERHALSVGFNLLNASVQANHRVEGEALLHRIGLLNAPHARDQVATFARSLDELKAAELGPPEAAEPEAALYTTDVEPMAIIPVVRGLGPVVPAEGWPPEDVIDLGRTEGAELDYIVTGSIAQTETATSVRLELWDIERGEAVDSLTKETTAEDAGTALLDLGQ